MARFVFRWVFLIAWSQVICVASEVKQEANPSGTSSNTGNSSATAPLAAYVLDVVRDALEDSPEGPKVNPKLITSAVINYYAKNKQFWHDVHYQMCHINNQVFGAPRVLFDFASASASDFLNPEVMLSYKGKIHKISDLEPGSLPHQAFVYRMLQRSLLSAHIVSMCAKARRDQFNEFMSRAWSAKNDACHESSHDFMAGVIFDEAQRLQRLIKSIKNSIHAATLDENSAPKNVYLQRNERMIDDTMKTLFPEYSKNQIDHKSLRLAKLFDRSKILPKYEGYWRDIKLVEHIFRSFIRQKEAKDGFIKYITQQNLNQRRAEIFNNFIFAMQDKASLYEWVLLATRLPQTISVLSYGGHSLDHQFLGAIAVCQDYYRIGWLIHSNQISQVSRFKIEGSRRFNNPKLPECLKFVLPMYQDIKIRRAGELLRGALWQLSLKNDTDILRGVMLRTLVHRWIPDAFSSAAKTFNRSLIVPVIKERTLDLMVKDGFSAQNPRLVPLFFHHFEALRKIYKNQKKMFYAHITQHLGDEKYVPDEWKVFPQITALVPQLKASDAQNYFALKAEWIEPDGKPSFFHALAQKKRLLRQHFNKAPEERSTINLQTFFDTLRLDQSETRHVLSTMKRKVELMQHVLCHYKINGTQKNPQHGFDKELKALAGFYATVTAASEIEFEKNLSSLSAQDIQNSKDATKGSQKTKSKKKKQKATVKTSGASAEAQSAVIEDEPKSEAKADESQPSISIRVAGRELDIQLPPSLMQHDTQQTSSNANKVSTKTPAHAAGQKSIFLEESALSADKSNKLPHVKPEKSDVDDTLAETRTHANSSIETTVQPQSSCEEIPPSPVASKRKEKVAVSQGESGKEMLSTTSVSDKSISAKQESISSQVVAKDEVALAQEIETHAPQPVHQQDKGYEELLPLVHKLQEIIASSSDSSDSSPRETGTVEESASSAQEDLLQRYEWVIWQQQAMLEHSARTIDNLLNERDFIAFVHQNNILQNPRMLLARFQMIAEHSQNTAKILRDENATLIEAHQQQLHRERVEKHLLLETAMRLAGLTREQLYAGMEETKRLAYQRHENEMRQILVQRNTEESRASNALSSSSTSSLAPQYQFLKRPDPNN